MSSEVPEFDGPAMSALPQQRMRLFAIAYMQNGGNAVQASRDAGYAGVKMAGFRLLQRPDMLAALDELAQAKLKGLTPAAVHALSEILAEPTHKDHAKTVFGVLDRVGFHAKSEHKVTTSVELNDKQVISAIQKLAGELGVDPVKLLGRNAPALPAPTVEATFAEVSDDDLGDVLK